MAKEATSVATTGRPASPNGEGKKGGDGRKGAVNGGKGDGRKGAGKGAKGGKKGQEEEEKVARTTPATETAIKEFNFKDSKTVAGKSWASMAARNATAPAPAPEKPAAPKKEEVVAEPEPEPTPEPEPVAAEPTPEPVPEPVVEQPKPVKAAKKEKPAAPATPFDKQGDKVVISEPHPLHSRDVAARAATATLTGTTSPSYEAQVEKVVLPAGGAAAAKVVFSGVAPVEAPAKEKTTEKSRVQKEVHEKPAETVSQPITQAQPKKQPQPPSPQVAAAAATTSPTAAATTSPTAATPGAEEPMFDRTGWGTADKPTTWSGQSQPRPAAAAAPVPAQMQQTWNQQGQNLQNVNRSAFGSAGSGYQGKSDAFPQGQRQNGNYQNNKKGGSMNSNKQGGRGQYGGQQGGKGMSHNFNNYQYPFMGSWSYGNWGGGRNMQWQGATNYGNYPQYNYSQFYGMGYGFPPYGEDYYGNHGNFHNQQYGGGRDHKAIPNSAYSTYVHGGNHSRQGNSGKN